MKNESTPIVEPTITIEPKPAHYVTSLPRAWQIKPVSEKEARRPDSGYEGWTDKSKHAIGAPPDHKVVWAWPRFNPADHHLFHQIAKIYDPGDAYNSADPRNLAARIVQDWFERNRVQIVKDVQAYNSKDLTLDQAELNVERLKRQFEEAQQLMLGLKNQAETEEA